jgi:NAD(P)-dependent dehydrogenase (short-subunit alcohol dehydrogenase family)
VDKLFENETVIISGGLGDIGRALALEFAKYGGNIALCDIHPPAHAREFLEELKQFNIKPGYEQVDIVDAEAVSAWVTKVENELGIPGIIIANAATVTYAGINEITPAQWSRELRVNLDGAFHLTQSATARLLYHGLPGRVVFIGSWAAHSVHTKIPAYCVSKAGLRSLCKCMALELAPHNILVNELAPGYVDAGLSGRSFEKDPVMKMESLQKVPVKKLISASEVAQQVVLLCHPLNVHMTGSIVLMDGGLSLLC